MTLRDEGGSITAEFAVMLPAVLLVLVLCVGAASVSVQRIDVESAAASAARMLARGEGSGSATAAVGAASPGARLDASRSGDFVCATVSARVAFAAARAVGVTVSGRSCALAGNEGP